MNLFENYKRSGSTPNRCLEWQQTMRDVILHFQNQKEMLNEYFHFLEKGASFNAAFSKPRLSPGSYDILDAGWLLLWSNIYDSCMALPEYIERIKIAAENSQEARYAVLSILLDGKHFATRKPGRASQEEKDLAANDNYSFKFQAYGINFLFAMLRNHFWFWLSDGGSAASCGDNTEFMQEQLDILMEKLGPLDRVVCDDVFLAFKDKYGDRVYLHGWKKENNQPARNSRNRHILRKIRSPIENSFGDLIKYFPFFDKHTTWNAADKIILLRHIIQLGLCLHNIIRFKIYPLSEGKIKHIWWNGKRTYRWSTPEDQGETEFPMETRLDADLELVNEFLISQGQEPLTNLCRSTNTYPEPDIAEEVEIPTRDTFDEIVKKSNDSQTTNLNDFFSITSSDNDDEYDGSTFSDDDYVDPFQSNSSHNQQNLSSLHK